MLFNSKMQGKNMFLRQWTHLSLLTVFFFSFFLLAFTKISECECLCVFKLLDSCSVTGFGFRMKFAAVFVLLLCLSPGFSQGQTERSVLHVPPELPVLWDELRGLKQLVLSLKAEEVERRLVLRSVESRLRDGEVEAEQQRRSLDGLEGKTETDRKQLMELNAALMRKVEELQEQSAGG